MLSAGFTGKSGAGENGSRGRRKAEPIRVGGRGVGEAHSFDPRVWPCTKPDHPGLSLGEQLPPFCFPCVSLSQASVPSSAKPLDPPRQAFQCCRPARNPFLGLGVGVHPLGGAPRGGDRVVERGPGPRPGFAPGCPCDLEQGYWLLCPSVPSRGWVA